MCQCIRKICFIAPVQLEAIWWQNQTSTHLFLGESCMQLVLPVEFHTSVQQLGLPMYDKLLNQGKGAEAGCYLAPPTPYLLFPAKQLTGMSVVYFTGLWSCSFCCWKQTQLTEDLRLQVYKCLLCYHILLNISVTSMYNLAIMLCELVKEYPKVF